MSYRVLRTFDFGPRSFHRDDEVTDGDLRMADDRASRARVKQLERLRYIEAIPEPVKATPAPPKAKTKKGK